MDFGLFFLMQRDEAWSEQHVYDSALDQMLAAEPMGYHSVWIAEHHFNDYGLCPTPPVLASFVAARTRSLRLGMGVSLLPLHHPVDLAEQLAVLDVVSGGRLDVGIGRGGTLQDYQTFRSDRSDSRTRVEEGIALMRECWSGRAFDFQGRFHAAERLHVRRIVKLRTQQLPKVFAEDWKVPMARPGEANPILRGQHSPVDRRHAPRPPRHQPERAVDDRNRRCGPLSFLSE